MRRGLKYPSTYEEAKKRIATDLAQISWSVKMADGGSFDRLVAYRYPVPEGAPPELTREVQAELDHARTALSLRVARFFRRNRRISLVCALLRQSPVFLCDDWVNELFLKRKRTALRDPDIRVRRQALRDLKALSSAITSERLPSGEWRRVQKWRQIRADRPWKEHMRSLHLINRYNCYVELATCLKQVRVLTADQRHREHERVEVSVAKHAEALGVRPVWLEQCWKGATRPCDWALRRLAEDDGCTPGATRRALANAEKLSKECLVGSRRVSAAAERLAPDRKRRAIERLKEQRMAALRRY